VEPRLPLIESDFIRLGYQPFKGDYCRRSLWLNGWALQATIAFGRRASPSDKQAVWRTVASLQLPALRVGEITGQDFVVAELASAYPIGSVTRVGSAFLIHAPYGFYAVSSHPFSTLSPNGEDCRQGLRVRRARRSRSRARMVAAGIAWAGPSGRTPGSSPSSVLHPPR
jgi:hypothetical protein